MPLNHRSCTLHSCVSQLPCPEDPEPVDGARNWSLARLLKDDDHAESTEQDPVILERISCRGPDSIRTSHAVIKDVSLTFTSSVLHLRGTSITVQPVIDEAGNTLCWNGEAWSGLNCSETENDTTNLFSSLVSHNSSVVHVLAAIRGPYAIVYYEEKSRKLWFARDVLGRRSLMIQKTTNGFVLSSVGKRTEGNWKEVQAGVIHSYDIQTHEMDRHAWTEHSSDDVLRKPYPRVNSSIPITPAEGIDWSLPFYTDATAQFLEVLREAVRIRSVTIPTGKVDNSTSRVAVMYSGGVDCAVLTRLLHDMLPKDEPIDLLNVSFENPRTVANARKSNPTFDKVYDTPDRLTGLQGYNELVQICSDRYWRFVEINIPYDEAQSAKEDVLDLMYPNDSIMDFSIALAFYFCARGQGTTTIDGRPTPYSTEAKVFFSGLGADEQLGGYSRHSAAWRQGGHAALIAELQMDLDRIPSRNLGRDDRILGAFAREVRWPFLDESVVSFLCALQVDQKMSLDIPGGDKILLREVGRKLGIPKASAEKKRAIQFGSRSARMEPELGGRNGVKGHNKQL